MNPLLTNGATPRGDCALSVNVNKVALLRNTRALEIPSVVRIATLALEAGAHGITVHPRPDARHIRPHDVQALAELLVGWPGAEYNIEGNPLHNLMAIVRELCRSGRPPHQVTFVPDSVAQATSDHGWQLPQQSAELSPSIAEAKALGVRVSLFIDPTPEIIPAVAALGADRIELYTERFARTHGTADGAAVSQTFAATAMAALQHGLGINAGHDLNRSNLIDFLRAVPGVQEVSIGHALIADALELGIGDTVRDYLRCVPGGRGVVMIYGIGTDICDVRRIAATLARRGERFAERVLGPNELAVFRQRRAKVEARGTAYLATRFSAKEAFSKAIGLGLRMPMTWRACEILNERSGKPYIALHGALAAWFDERGLHARVSVSDETDYAASFVVVEAGVKRERPDDPTR